jgi:hypothetical protein
MQEAWLLIDWNEFTFLLQIQTLIPSFPALLWTQKRNALWGVSFELWF